MTTAGAEEEGGASVGRTGSGATAGTTTGSTGSWQTAAFFRFTLIRTSATSEPGEDRMCRERSPSSKRNAAVEVALGAWNVPAGRSRTFTRICRENAHSVVGAKPPDI